MNSDPQESSCIFCRIAHGDLPTELVWQDEETVAFRDVQPQAPVHVLIVPRKHYATLAHLEDDTVAGRLVFAAKKVAEKLKIGQYRLVINTGPEAGQSVFHLHLHLLAGRTMGWPPG
jgi:histidine triad (HIT) family protein